MVVVEDLEDHVRLVGILTLVLGGLAALGAVILLLVSGFLLFPRGGLSDWNPLYVVALPLGVLTVLALWGIGAGAGLVSRQAWARPLALGFAALNLVNVPFGTAYGVYGLWALSREGVEEVLSGTVFWRPEQPP